MSADKENKKNGETPEFHVNEQELQALRQRITDRIIEEKDWDLIDRYLLLLLKLSQVFQYGRIRMRKIVRMLFGKRTEKEKKKKDPPNNPPSPVGENTAPAAGGEQRSEPAPPSENQRKEAKKGHGRRPASDYQNAETQICPLCHNKPRSEERRVG